MPISSTTRKAGPFIGNGTAATFPFSFKVFQSYDLAVLKSDGMTESTLVIDSDYSVSLNADQDANPGGSVTLTAGNLATGLKLYIVSNVSQTQPLQLANGGAFNAEVLNDAFDRVTMLVQQVQEQINHSLQYSVTDGVPGALPMPTDRANKFLYFGNDGSPSLLAAAPMGAALFAGTLNGTKDGVNRVFTLTNNGSPLGKAPLQVTVWQNYPLVKDVGYTLGPEPGQITFTVPPVADDTLFAQGAY